MDTSSGDNGREGYCIEIQALMMALFRSMYGMTGDNNYKIDEENLRKNVLLNFYKKDKPGKKDEKKK